MFSGLTGRLSRVTRRFVEACVMLQLVSRVAFHEARGAIR